MLMLLLEFVITINKFHFYVSVVVIVVVIGVNKAIDLYTTLITITVSNRY